MTYILRTLEQTLARLTSSQPVIMVTGPRQSGKSTLLQHFLTSKGHKFDYVSFDDPLMRAQAIQDPKLFLTNFLRPLIIDEFQYVPEILPYLKIEIDQLRWQRLRAGIDKPVCQFYLTGSQTFQTMKNVSESLAGRIEILDLYPLSNRELSEGKEEPFWPEINRLRRRRPTKALTGLPLFERFLQGGFPELHTNTHVDRERFFAEYIRTYMERDVRDIANIKNETKFFQFVCSLAARTGQEYNPTDIARDVEVDRLTVEAWTSILKNTYLIYLLQPYYNNDVSRAIKRPKIYFMDTGLACYLTGYADPRALGLSNYIGAIFETYVVTQVIKSLTNNGFDPRLHLYYYRDTLKREIDLLIVRNGQMYPVEIKKSTHPDQKAAKHFDLVDQFPYRRQPGIILCLADRLQAIDEQTYLVPLEYI